MFNEKNRLEQFIAIIMIVVIFLAGCSKEMKEPVELSITGTISENYQILISAKTNLPEETNLILSLSDLNGQEIYGSTKAKVSSVGNIEFEAVGPDQGLGNGEYFLSILMPISSTQSANVQSVIGKNGEFLRGDLVKEGNLGKTVEFNSEIEITGSPVTSMDEKKDVELEKNKQLVEDFKRLYNQLITFKDSKEFLTYGFVIGGSYNDWLREVEKLSNFYEGMTQIKNGLIFGELRELGFEYMRTSGNENEFTSSQNESFKESLENIF